MRVVMIKMWQKLKIVKLSGAFMTLNYKVIFLSTLLLLAAVMAVGASTVIEPGEKIESGGLFELNGHVYWYLNIEDTKGNSRGYFSYDNQVITSSFFYLSNYNEYFVESSDKKHHAFMVSCKEGDFIMHDGKRSKFYDGSIKRVSLSPDGQKVAFILNDDGDDSQSVVLNDVEGESFNYIGSLELNFTADNSLLYIGEKKDGEDYFIAGDKRIGPYDYISSPVFSADRSHFYIKCQTKDRRDYLYYDLKRVEEETDPTYFTFLNNGEHYIINQWQRVGSKRKPHILYDGNFCDVKDDIPFEDDNNNRYYAYIIKFADGYQLSVHDRIVARGKELIKEFHFLGELESYAYVVKEQDGYYAVLPDKRVGPFEELTLDYSWSDGLYGLGRKKNKVTIIQNDKVYSNLDSKIDSISGVVHCSDGRHSAVQLEMGDKEAVLFNGKLLKARLDHIYSAEFMDNCKSYAMMGWIEDFYYLYLNNRLIERADKLESLHCTESSKSLYYSKRDDIKVTPVFNGKRYPQVESISNIRVTENGKAVVYNSRRDGLYYLHYNGRQINIPSTSEIREFYHSPDHKHRYYLVRNRDGDYEYVYNGEVIFRADFIKGKRVIGSEAAFIVSKDKKSYYIRNNRVEGPYEMITFLDESSQKEVVELRDKGKRSILLINGKKVNEHKLSGSKDGIVAFQWNSDESQYYYKLLRNSKERHYLNGRELNDYERYLTVQFAPHEKNPYYAVIEENRLFTVVNGVKGTPLEIDLDEEYPRAQFIFNEALDEYIYYSPGDFLIYNGKEGSKVDIYSLSDRKYTPNNRFYTIYFNRADLLINGKLYEEVDSDYPLKFNHDYSDYLIPHKAWENSERVYYISSKEAKHGPFEEIISYHFHSDGKSFIYSVREIDGNYTVYDHKGSKVTDGYFVNHSARHNSYLILTSINGELVVTTAEGRVILD